MKTNRILTIAVVLLLLVNVAMLIFMLKGRGHHDMKNRGGGPFDMMVKELSMTEQQQTEFKKLKEEHFSAIKPVFDSVRTLKKSLFGLVKNENVNDSLVNNFSSLVFQQQTIIDKLTINHFRRVRALFSGDQQKKFDDFVQKMMQHRGGPQGGWRKDSIRKGQ
jgi:Spy/CpxP family protein refolding chaperone